MYTYIQTNHKLFSFASTDKVLNKLNFQRKIAIRPTKKKTKKAKELLPVSNPQFLLKIISKNPVRVRIFFWVHAGATWEPIWVHHIKFSYCEVLVIIGP